MESIIKNIKKYLYLIWTFSRNSVKVSLMYPIGSMFFVVGKIIRFGMFFLFIYFLVTQTNTLKGYTVEQALIILMTFEVLNSAVQLLFREVYRFRSTVIQGGLDGILIRPFHPFIRILFGGLDILDGVILIFQLIILGVLLYISGPFTVAQLSLYGIMLLNALLLFSVLHILVFVIVLNTNTDQVLWIIRDLSDTGRLPIDIYQQPLRFILTFIFPVGIMMTYPAQGLYGILSFQNMLLSFGITILFFVVILHWWDVSLKKYQSWGG